MATKVLAPYTTPLDPNAPVEPVNSSPPPGGGPPNPTPVPGITPLNPAFRDGPAKPTPIPTTPNYPGGPSAPTGATTTANATPGVPAQPATGITQLPDGAGGAIPVPPPSVTAPPTQQFGPGSNLINTQINPTADPRVLKLQGLQDGSLDKILNGPDRNAMARDQYNTWEAETAPDFEHAITDATDAAAAHGQIRSGQLTNRYGDLARQRVLDQTTARNRYMQQALEDSIGDTQRGFEDVSGAAGTAYNQGLTGREELRGERGYQQSQAEQALLNRIRQQQAESGAEAQSFGEGTTAYGLGMEGDPTGVYQDASAQASDEAAAAAGDTGALLRLLALRRNQPAAA